MKKKSLLLALALVISLSLVACSGSEMLEDVKDDVETKVIDVEQTYNEIMGSYEAESENSFTQVDDKIVEEQYYIDPDDLISYKGAISNIDVQADEHFVAEVKPGKMDDVKAGLEKRAEDLNRAWSERDDMPQAYDVVKNYQIIEMGDYIYFGVADNIDSKVDIFNAQMN